MRELNSKRSCKAADDLVHCDPTCSGIGVSGTCLTTYIGLIKSEGSYLRSSACLREFTVERNPVDGVPRIRR